MDSNSQAYIPYVTAQKHMIKVLDDLHNVKNVYNTLLERNCSKIQKDTEGLFKDAFDILQCQYKEKIDGVKKILETTTKIVIDSQNAKDDAWSSKVKNLKEQNLKLMSEVNQLIEYNRKFKKRTDYEKEKELLSLKSSFNTSKKDLMSSLKNREESCKTQYDSHIEILKAFYNDKLIRIEKQSSLEHAKITNSLTEEHQTELQQERLKMSNLFNSKLNEEKKLYENKIKELAISSDNDLKSKIENTQTVFGEQIDKLESNYRDKIEALKTEKENLLCSHHDELKQSKIDAGRELKNAGDLSNKTMEELSRKAELQIIQLTSKYTDTQLELSQTTDSFNQFKNQSIQEKEALMAKQDHEIEALVSQLKSIEEGRDDLKEEWRREKEDIELSYNEKIERLQTTISENEAEIQKHEAAFEAVQNDMENDMKTFETAKKEELEKIVQANDEEKQILVEKLEKLTEETELRVRKSLSKMQFHQAEQEKLENKNDMLEKERQVVDEEKDAAQAESHVGIQEKMQLTISQRELTMVELKTVKSNRKSLETDIRKSGGIVSVGLGSVSRENIAPVASKDQVAGKMNDERQIKIRSEGRLLLEGKEGTIDDSGGQESILKKEAFDSNDSTGPKTELNQLYVQKTALETLLENQKSENSELASLNRRLMSEVDSTKLVMGTKDEVIKSKEKALTIMENDITHKEEVIKKLRDEITDLEAERHSVFDLDSRNEIQKFKDKLMLAEDEMEITEKMQRRKQEDNDEDVAKLESTVAQTKNELLNLQNQLTQTQDQHNKEIHQIIAEKDSEVVALQFELADVIKSPDHKQTQLQTQLEETQYLLEVKDKMITEKDRRLGDMDKELESLRNELSEPPVISGVTATRGNAGAGSRVGSRAGSRGGPRGTTSSPRGTNSNARGAAVSNPRAQRLMETQISTLKSKNEGLSGKVSELEQEIGELKKNLRTAEAEIKKTKDAAGANKDARKFEITKKTLDETRAKLDKLTSTSQSLEKENKSLKEEVSGLTKTTKELESVCGDTQEMKEQLSQLNDRVKHLQSENSELVENYNSERILRKKYYNQIEDMKGKIRVFCRARPISNSEIERGNFNVILSPDEYTLAVETKRGPRDFSFDQVFTPETRGEQEHVFEDVKMLVQSAVDGYNVCIFAYGQTGSGKTFTMIGNEAFPGIAPRSFKEIFDLLESNVKKFSFSVTLYMCELYNDMLIDLLDKGNDKKLDIKKDKKGMIFVQNISVKTVMSAKDLMKTFNLGSSNRHVASTKMNAESSRSHLVISVVMETTNNATGAVLRGKLSLVDLAGSERAAKTEATPEQLKEAQSINKSLSALGDVISALSSEASYVPYRNNKLTMLMQDSLGGNAKTLMFVNISPVDYNTDETIVSLTYASRVKLITNAASKNAESKEISRLKGIIARLKKGQQEEEDTGDEEGAT